MCEPLVRLVRPTDINNLTVMDLKCYHYPMTLEDWKQKIKDKKTNTQIIIVEFRRHPVGFAMWSVEQLENEYVGKILRLGVLPQYRRKHFGKLLLTFIFKYLRDWKCNKVQIVVSSLHCLPGDPDDVSEFLTKCGFQTTGEVVSEFKWMYGDLVDGYIFERNTDAFTD